MKMATRSHPCDAGFSPEARNAKLDEALRGLVEGRSTPAIVALIPQDGRPVYSRSVGVREVGSTALIGENDMLRDARVTDGLDQPEVTTAEAMQRLAPFRLAISLEQAVNTRLRPTCSGPSSRR
jgi:hypothetical protein